MEIKSPDKVTAFDTLFTTNHIQMLKILLVFAHPSAQKQLAVYIKLLELRYTLLFFQNHPHAAFPLQAETFDKKALIDELLPFCSPSEKEKMQNFKNICQNIENMQEIMQFMEMLREISPESFAPDAAASDAASPGSATSGAASPGSATSDENTARPDQASDLSWLLTMLSASGGPDLSELSKLFRETMQTK